MGNLGSPHLQENSPHNFQSSKMQLNFVNVYCSTLLVVCYSSL